MSDSDAWNKKVKEKEDRETGNDIEMIPPPADQIRIRRESKPSEHQRKQRKRRAPSEQPRGEFSVGGSSTDEDEQLKIQIPKGLRGQIQSIAFKPSQQTEDLDNFISERMKLYEESPDVQPLRSPNKNEVKYSNKGETC